MHQRFSADSAGQPSLVYPLAYDTVVAGPDASLERLARFARLARRAEPKALPN